MYILRCSNTAYNTTIHIQVKDVVMQKIAIQIKDVVIPKKYLQIHKNENTFL